MSRHSNNGDISIFNNYFDSKPIMTGDVMTYLNNVKEGLWKEEVQLARESKKGSKTYDKIKKTLTAVTMSGVFAPDRLDANLVTHSGFICMDFDHLPDVSALKEELKADEFTFAVFESISGQGLALILKISKPESHRDYFTVIREYYRTKYNVEADAKCINVSRLRGATFDPDCYVNTDSKTWSKLTGLKKANKPKPTANIIATRSDFDVLINDIITKGVDITNGYENWLSCGFALAEEFGESGREYFQSISQMSEQYDNKSCDRQYDHCLNSDNGSKITIGTFYFFCKNQGLEISSKLTREAVNIVSLKRSANYTESETLEYIEHLELSAEDSEYIVKKVFSSPVNRQFVEDLPLAERIELYILNTYDIKLNELGEFIEIDNQPMKARKMNQLWLECLKFVDEKTPQSLVKAALDSDKIPSYNPIKKYFEDNESLTGSGHIDKIADSIPSHTALDGMTSQEYKRTFLKKWLVGMIAGVYGDPNPLVLAMVGDKTDTGKTEFFRRLLPEDLQRFQDEATLDDSNDRGNIIKLVKNMLIFDDEGASRNYKESQKFKALTSKKTIRIRKLHTSVEEEYLRIATLAITSNEIDVIKEETNRRIIPVEVTDKMDHELFNSVDKKAMIMEAYHLWKSGFDHLINRNEIEGFNQSLSEHMEEDITADAILGCITPGVIAVPTAMILDYVTFKFSFMKLSTVLFGKKMKKSGFERVQSRREGVRIWCYKLDEISHKTIQNHSNSEINYQDVNGKKPLDNVGGKAIQIDFKEQEETDDLPF